MKKYIALFGILFICVFLVLFIFVGKRVPNMENTATKYISEKYGVDRNWVEITTYSTADEEEIETFKHIYGNGKIKEAVYDIEVKYPDPGNIMLDERDYIDVMYKDNDGWHIDD